MKYLKLAFNKRFLFLGLVLILPYSYCKAGPVAPLKNFTVEGKIAIRHERSGGNVSVVWHQQNSHYAIRLMGALGAGSIEIEGGPGKVGLIDTEGRHHQARTPEQLIHQVLGWSIPVSPLRYWLQGLPCPNTPITRQFFDEANRLVLLQQQGWKIEYQEYIQQKGRFLPIKLTLQHGNVKLKFVFKRWRF